MDEITVREARTQEIRTLSELSTAALPQEFKGVLKSEEIDFMVERMYSLEVLQSSMGEGRRYFIAALDGKDCGFGSFIQEGPDLFLINKLYVIDGYQNRGVGTTLFNTICAEIKKVHPEPCTAELIANHSNGALSFYEKRGMKFSREMIFDLDSFELVERVYTIEI